MACSYRSSIIGPSGLTTEMLREAAASLARKKENKPNYHFNTEEPQKMIKFDVVYDSVEEAENDIPKRTFWEKVKNFFTNKEVSDCVKELEELKKQRNKEAECREFGHHFRTVQIQGDRWNGEYWCITGVCERCGYEKKISSNDRTECAVNVLLEEVKK